MEAVKSVAPMVLVFEDEPVLREMMGMILSGEGINFRSYDHPVMELAVEHDCTAPDAPCKGISGIISDVMMPVVDGLTFYEHLVQSNCKLRNSMLVLMSAIDHRRQLQSSLCAGHVHYLDKPFVVKELQQVLKKHLTH